MNKYFIYCRKSTEEEERQILSIEAQLTELRDYAKREGLLVVKEYTESRSAKEPGRHVFNQMMSEIEQGSAQGILAWNPDRLARNSVDGGRIIYLVDTGKIKFLKFPTFWFEPTPQGKFMLSVAFGQAKYYTDNLRENIWRGIRQKLRRGEFPARAPLGYFNEPRLRTIEPNPKTFGKMKKILEAFATGNYTLSQICDKMFSLGLIGARSKKKYSLSSVEHNLKNPFYYGHFLYRGELHEGTHKPMISKKLFDQIQRELKDKCKPRKKQPDKRPFLFLNFAQCGECGYSITAERHIKKSGLEFVYYRCSKRSKKQKCSQGFLRDNAFAKQVKNYVQKVSLSDTWRDRYLKRLDAWEKESRQSSDLIAQKLKAELNRVKTRIDRLTDAYLDGTLELIEFQEKKNSLIKQKRDIEEKLSDFERKGNHWLELTRNWILEANSAENLALQEDYRGMKDFLQKIGSNRRLAAGTLSVDFKKPWNFIDKMTAESRRDSASPAKNQKWWS
jgi:DNA invertase Pin-like site-specific DNA recombinase